MSPPNLSNANLWRTDCYINGEWARASTGNAFTVINPSTERTIATLPDCTAQDVSIASNHAARAFKNWKTTNPKTRGTILRKWADLLIANAADIGTILTMENGKPYAEAKGEVAFAASYLHFYAGEAERQYGEVVPSLTNADNRVFALQQPIGVVACLTPWNFPAAMVTRKAGAAIAAGCSVVLKPAGETSLTALAIAHLGAEAGLPAGVLNVVTCGPQRLAEVGEALCREPTIKKLSFTGSTAVGKLLMKQCADSLKKLSLELGGNAPFIVFDDCDLETALDAVMAAKVRNSGQTCVCANRIYVQRGVYEAFSKGLVGRFQKLKFGDGFGDGVVVGPLTTGRGLEKVQAHVRDAIQKGADVLFGKPTEKSESSGDGGSGFFVQPAVLSGMKPDMLSHGEEIFGPVAPLYAFDTEEEVLEMANASEVGLGSYVCTQDHARMWRMGEGLEVGMVAINTGVIAGGEIPFSGVKHSGFGVEGGKWGLQEFQITKTMVMAVPDRRASKARI
ncbi:Glutarate-semialdehyde dehydrogenase DavD [Cyphellophora attinorum]|uniref:succinate-semialdehyde dehydrogenase [NAD(P)(+)] n=1 Tax=Cyphellophora attinorum TaxID=1664694 RepID=A0A0N1NXH7_9EURO|nr:Glutarate-semialdehyde dehydrogenase DavD [Phialophora attinorum]KPI37673.1 Glutarate-semialdehyde dehydrogenase DavD [Phialophora attinorum]